MSSAERRGLDDEVLIRYLLGQVPEEDAEHVEERSISDDESALRLSAVENDLVDAYVRGDLSGETLERFKVIYLSSPKRLEKVAFAQSLLRFNERTPVPGTEAVTGSASPSTGQRYQTWKEKLSRRWFTAPRSGIQWGFAAAVMMLLASGYLFVQNQRLRERATEAGQQQAAWEQRTQELQKQLSEQRIADREMLQELDKLRESQTSLDHAKTVTALLLPPTRGVSRIPTLSLAPGTSLVVLLLALETDDFPSYRVRLKDPVTNQIVWHSADLAAAPIGSNKTVSISFPARLLKQQNYVFELTGMTSKGHAEFITNYSVQLVAR